MINGEPSWTLPMPGRFVIAPDGVIAYAEVNPDYTRRPDPEALMLALRDAARKQAACAAAVQETDDDRSLLLADAQRS